VFVWWVFFFGLDHIMVSVQNVDVAELTEGSRCMLRVLLVPGSCSTDRSPEGARERKSYRCLISGRKTGDGIHPGRKRSNLCLLC